MLGWKLSDDRAAVNLPKFHFRALLGLLEGLFEAQRCSPYHTHRLPEFYLVTTIWSS